MPKLKATQHSVCILTTASTLLLCDAVTAQCLNHLEVGKAPLAKKNRMKPPRAME